MQERGRKTLCGWLYRYQMAEAPAPTPQPVVCPLAVLFSPMCWKKMVVL